MNNEDVELIKRRLLIKYPFFGSVVANSSFVEKDSIDTAATDGENIYYNLELLNSLNEGEQVFLFAHEVAHIAFNHVFRSEGKNKRLWNIATDAVINAFLRQDGLPLIKGGVNIENAINYDAEEMYNKLLKENNERNKNNNNSKNSNSTNSQLNGEETENNGQNENVGHDSHDLWDKAIEKSKKQKNDEKKNNENKNTSKDKKEDQIKKMTKLGEKEVFKQNKMERKKRLEKLKESLANETQSAGNSTNSAKLDIDDIGTSKMLVDWRRYLKEAIKYDVDWTYSNATIEEGVVMAHLDDIPRPETEIVLDTSGSINKNLLKNFLKECKNILQVSKVKVGCFDTKFYGFKEIRNEKDIDNMNFVGGGGTNFDVAVNAFSKRVENKIIFTDGCASMPKVAMDAIWVVFGDEKIKPKGGKVIYITKEQLYKLCMEKTKNR